MTWRQMKNKINKYINYGSQARQFLPTTTYLQQTVRQRTVQRVYLSWYYVFDIMFIFLILCLHVTCTKRTKINDHYYKCVLKLKSDFIQMTSYGASQSSSIIRLLAMSLELCSVLLVFHIIFMPWVICICEIISGLSGDSKLFI